MEALPPRGAPEAAPQGRQEAARGRQEAQGVGQGRQEAEAQEPCQLPGKEAAGDAPPGMFHRWHSPLL